MHLTTQMDKLACLIGYLIQNIPLTRHDINSEKVIPNHTSIPEKHCDMGLSRPTQKIIPKMNCNLTSYLP